MSQLYRIHPPSELERSYASFTRAEAAETEAIISQFAGVNQAAQLRQEHATHTASELGAQLGLTSC